MEPFWKGRGTSDNPKNRFEALERIKDRSDVVDPDDVEPSPKTQFIPDLSKSILSRNTSPDVGFEYSINPYRGCEHGCVYCYARPSHEYLGFSSGLDFETKIVVKESAPALLREALSNKKWEPQAVALSGNTDCYQPVERKLGLTRGCLEVFAEFRNPVFIITKNALVTRDIDVLQELNRYEAISVTLSVTSLDDELCQVLEPRTARPRKRLEAITKLAQAGIPVNVNLAPVIPGINDHEIADILKAAREAGATSAAYVMLRLPFQVKDLFCAWLETHYPDRKDKVLNRVKEIRGGRLNDPNFASRMRGSGIYAEQVKAQFRLWHRKLGFEHDRTPLNVGDFRRPIKPGEQLGLFE